MRVVSAGVTAGTCWLPGGQGRSAGVTAPGDADEVLTMGSNLCHLLALQADPLHADLCATLILCLFCPFRISTSPAQAASQLSAKPSSRSRICSCVEVRRTSPETASQGQPAGRPGRLEKHWFGFTSAGFSVGSAKSMQMPTWLPFSACMIDFSFSEQFQLALNSVTDTKMNASLWKLVQC